MVTFNDSSLWMYFINASPVVKFVMLLLLGASVLSWTLIFQRAFIIKNARKYFSRFEERFWSGMDLNKVYAEGSELKTHTGIESIFRAGFKEYMRMRRSQAAPENTFDAVQRAMRIAQAREVENLEQHLPTLATIGSTSPYIGLFGTVWGIMTAFQALGHMQQVSIGTVAPGISEALIATAMGLFAAIPAVIAYNRFANHVDRLVNQYDTFQEEFSTILHRLVYTSVKT